MPKPINHGKRWTTSDVNELRAIRKRPIDEIARELGRTQDAVRNKASEKHISLMPPS